jgi:hypothetical protein
MLTERKGKAIEIIIKTVLIPLIATRYDKFVRLIGIPQI